MINTHVFDKLIQHSFYNIAHKDPLAIQYINIFVSLFYYYKLILYIIYTKRNSRNIRISFCLFRLNYFAKQNFTVLWNRSTKLKHVFLNISQSRKNRKTKKPLLALSGGILILGKQ